jgi:apolipoprotein N-acyltransferase
MKTSKRLAIPLAIAISGAFWYMSLDLGLHAWWAAWVAPIPVLYLSLRISGWQSFWAAFASYLIGWCSWIPYLLTILPLPLLLLVAALFTLPMALVVVITRKIILRCPLPPMAALFVYPVLLTAAEYLQFLLSRDGTFGSIAYTQCNFLPVVQIASLTGILGISFMVSLVPWMAVLVIQYRGQGRKIGSLVLPGMSLVALVMIYGLLRLQDNHRGGYTKAGLAAIPMSTYKNVYDTSIEEQLRISWLYLNEVSSLAGRGAQVILLPEKCIPVSDATEPFIQGLFGDSSHRLGVTIIAGFTRMYKGHMECQARVFSPDGHEKLNYRKVNLFEGEVLNGFVAGREPAFFEQQGMRTGVAICKDLDFQRYILLYGKMGTSVMYVPAWDFDKDGWLHARMAMMRAVENGFVLVRNAQQGRLTISDDRGRVRTEASSENNRSASVIGEFSCKTAGATLYSRWGDWFGRLNLFLAVCQIVMLSQFFRKASSTSAPKPAVSGISSI